MYHKNNHAFVLILLFIFSGSLFLFPVPGTEEYPDTVLGKRFQEVVKLFNEAEPQKWEEYLNQGFSNKFVKRMTRLEHLDVFNHHCDTYGNLQFKGITRATDFRGSARVWSESMEWWLELGIMLEEKPPHKIRGIYLDSGDAPGGWTPEKKFSHQEIVKNLEPFIKKLVAKDRFSGTVLLAKKGKVLFKGAYGLASKRFNVPNRIDTKFNLGSMNKMFTAVAVAQLVEKGKLSFEDTIDKYLDSGWINPDAAKKVKIKHLLTHTSGLGSYFNRKFMNSSRLLFRRLEDFQSLVKDEKLSFEPGTRWAYSNTGMLLAGAVIAKASGQNYFDYIREHIYKPAGMKNTDCYEMDRPVPNLAIGYDRAYNKKGPYWQNNIFLHVVKGGPAGGGFSTVEDLVRFAQALEAGKLISKKSAQLLMSPKPGLKSPDYGYGFGVGKAGDETIAGHSGGFPGINSILRIYRKSGYVYVILSNYSGGMSDVRTKLNALITSAL
ncbi:MAG: beta-lactamase family protein [bacterium]|nr:beta-lactamase family protein [bacterium]